MILVDLAELRQTAGWVDAHSHLRWAGLADQGVTSGCLEEALLRMSAMTAVELEEDAFAASCDLLLSGVTAVQVVFHSFATPDEYVSQASAMIRGALRSGIRFRVILAMTDQAEYLPQGREIPHWLPPAANPSRGTSPLQFLDLVRHMVREHPTIDFGIGPVAPQWASDELMSVLGQLSSEGLRVHSHLLESRRQRAWVKPDPVTRLSDFGLLGESTSLAHGVWCSAYDLERIADSGSQLVACPQSNMVLGAGKASVALWDQLGIPIAIGLDSVTSNPDAWAVARMYFPDSTALECLTHGGVLAAGLHGDQDLVLWQSMVDSKPYRVQVAKRTVVDQGQLLLHEEYQEAQNRLLGVLDADRDARIARQTALSETMKKYLDFIDESLV